MAKKKHALGQARKAVLFFLRKNLKKETFRHVLGAAGMAAVLARRYGADEGAAEIAALLHDCAKDMSPAELIAAKKKYGARIGKNEKKIPAVWHGIVAEKIAEKEFGVRDRRVLRAVKLHSTGGRRMGKLEKIIYAADFMEPGREYRESKNLRKMLKKNITLDCLVAGVLKHKVKYLQKKGMLIHPATKLLYKQLKTNR